MASNNPNYPNDGYSEYDDTTTGFGSSTMDDIDDDDGYGYDNNTSGTGYDDENYDNTTTGYDDNYTAPSGYDDSTFQTDGDDPSRFNEYADDYQDNARYNPGVGETYDTNMDEEDEGEDASRFNEYSEDAENPGTGERYDANVPEGEEGEDVPSPPPGTRQYNPYNYEDYQEDFYDDDTEGTPLNPSVRSYRGFDRDADFQDEYDSDEEEPTPSSFYKGREQYEYRKDEAEEEKRIKKVKKRNFRDATTGMKVVGAICCCCICLITILILLLVFLVFKDEIEANNAKNDPKKGPNGGRTNRPTPRPTYPIPPALRPALEGRPDVLSPWVRITDEPTRSAYPTDLRSMIPTDFPTGLPTPKPTLSMQPTRPVPPTIILPAAADTYVYVDGFFQYEAYGTEDTFLVQNGLSEYYEFADAMGLIQFDLRSLPTKAQMVAYDAQAILKLRHLPVNEKFNTREPGTISVRKLLSTPMRIETLHGGMVDAIPSGSIMGENSVTVGLTQDLVYLDVTDLLYPTNFTEDGYDRKQLLLMLFNNATEQGDPAWSELEWQDQAGDRFKSIESGDGPSLTISYIDKGSGGTPSPTDVTPAPSAAPSESQAPSSFPSFIPSGSPSKAP